MKSSIVLLLVGSLLMSSCGKDTGELLDILGPLGFGKIILVSSNTTTRSVTSYELNGDFNQVLVDLNSVGSNPRGIADYDDDGFILSVDTPDYLAHINFTSGPEIFAVNAQLTGNLYDIERAPDGSYFVIESNTIEQFTSTGIRTPLSGTAPYIPTTLGSCVLSTPRSLSFGPTGLLYVVGTGGSDTLNIYDVSGSNPSCLASVSLAGLNPQSVLAHSNGSVYVGTTTDDKIYSFNFDGSGQGVFWETDLSVISDPTALAEMPDGSILVASTLLDSVERILITGERASSTPFIKDIGSFDVIDILVKEPSD